MSEALKEESKRWYTPVCASETDRERQSMGYTTTDREHAHRTYIFVKSLYTCVYERDQQRGGKTLRERVVVVRERTRVRTTENSSTAFFTYLCCVRESEREREKERVGESVRVRERDQERECERACARAPYSKRGGESVHECVSIDNTSRS